jgi:hypothetical protein
MAAARRLHIAVSAPTRTLTSPLIFGHCRAQANFIRNVHIRATPSTTSLDGLMDLSEQTQSIPKLSGAGPFPAGMSDEGYRESKGEKGRDGEKGLG